MGAMSRLRRLVVSDRWFFITCRILSRRRILSESEFACLARVIHERREERGFLLSAWVFLPDHGHALIWPQSPNLACRGGSRTAPTSCLAREPGGRRVKLCVFGMTGMTTGRVRDANRRATLCASQPVKVGLVSHPEGWPWSSVHDYAGTIN